MAVLSRVAAACDKQLCCRVQTLQGKDGTELVALVESDFKQLQVVQVFRV